MVRRSNTETKYGVTMAGLRRMMNDHFNFKEKCDEFHEDSDDQHFEEKFEINMLAANDVNLRILTYLLRSRK